MIPSDKRDAALEAIRKIQQAGGVSDPTSFRKYSDDQPRDDHGRWEGGGSESSGPADHGGSDPSGHGSSGSRAGTSAGREPSVRGPDKYGSIRDYNQALQAYADHWSSQTTERVQAEHDKLDSRLRSTSAAGSSGRTSLGRRSGAQQALEDKRDELSGILRERRG